MYGDDASLCGSLYSDSRWDDNVTKRLTYDHSTMVSGCPAPRITGVGPQMDIETPERTTETVPKLSPSCDVVEKIVVTCSMLDVLGRLESAVLMQYVAMHENDMRVEGSKVQNPLHISSKIREILAERERCKDDGASKTSPPQNNAQQRAVPLPSVQLPVTPTLTDIPMRSLDAMSDIDFAHTPTLPERRI